jgi:hypothetical protein
MTAQEVTFIRYPYKRLIPISNSADERRTARGSARGDIKPRPKALK